MAQVQMREAHQHGAKANGNVMVTGYDKHPPEDNGSGGFNWWGLLVLLVPVAVIVAAFRVLTGW